VTILPRLSRQRGLPAAVAQPTAEAVRITGNAVVHLPGMKTKQIKMDPELARDDSHRTAADLACRTSTRKTLELVCGARAEGDDASAVVSSGGSRNRQNRGNERSLENTDPGYGVRVLYMTRRTGGTGRRFGFPSKYRTEEES